MRGFDEEANSTEIFEDRLTLQFKFGLADILKIARIVLRQRLGFCIMSAAISARKSTIKPVRAPRWRVFFWIRHRLFSPIDLEELAKRGLVDQAPATDFDGLQPASFDVLKQRVHGNSRDCRRIANAVHLNVGASNGFVTHRLTSFDLV
jgi:hypothetical protein